MMVIESTPCGLSPLSAVQGSVSLTLLAGGGARYVTIFPERPTIVPKVAEQSTVGAGLPVSVNANCAVAPGLTVTVSGPKKVRTGGVIWAVVKLNPLDEPTVPSVSRDTTEYWYWVPGVRLLIGTLCDV